MKYFKLIGILSLLVFSFFLTDVVTELAINSNPLMQTIKQNKKKYCENHVNAIIEKNTIIPGIKGKQVNEMESFLNMKDFGSFNNNYLVYDYFKPEVSLEDYLDKIIISGNKTLRQASILVKNNTNILNFLNEKNIKYSRLVNINDNLNSKENINIENEEKKFKDLDTLLNKKDINKKICIINYSNIKICKNKKYYLVKPNIELKNNNFINVINNLELGSIILIDDNLSLDNFKIFINKTKISDIKFVYLSDLIKE